MELFSARMYEWRSGDFSIQTWCIPLEAFASKNDNQLLFCYSVTDCSIYLNFFDDISLYVSGLLCGACQFELRDLEEACWKYIDRRIEYGCVDIILSSAKAYQQHRTANKIYKTVSR